MEALLGGDGCWPGYEGGNKRVWEPGGGVVFACTCAVRYLETATATATISTELILLPDNLDGKYERYL